MEQPKIGEKVSIWLEGIVQEVRTTSLGTLVEVYNKKTMAHCFVPLSAIEPKEGAK